MSDLLSELTLDYEILADDPIEMGIHFGQSILNHVSSSIDSARQYSNEVVEEVASAASKTVNFISSPRLRVSRQFSLEGRKLKARTVQNRIPTTSYLKRSAVTTGRATEANRYSGYSRRSNPKRPNLVGQI